MINPPTPFEGGAMITRTLHFSLFTFHFSLLHDSARAHPTRVHTQQDADEQAKPEQ